MPWKLDDPFEKPIEKNLKMWKYLPQDKFEILLEKQSFYFQRGDMLRQKDPNEGYFAEIVVHKPDDSPEVNRIVSQMKKHLDENSGKFHHFDFWHVNESESLQMWKQYAKNGIAIQTTFDRLMNSILSDETVLISKIKYNNENKFNTKLGNLIDIFSKKEEKYDFENELRLCISDYPQLHGTSRLIPVNLNSMIEAIYVSPWESSKSLELTKSKIKTHGLDELVVLSSKLVQD